MRCFLLETLPRLTFGLRETAFKGNGPFLNAPLRACFTRRSVSSGVNFSLSVLISKAFRDRFMDHHVYESIGYCIFCCASDVPLSKEHIIPEAIGGKLVIRHATCAKCRDVHQKFEPACLKGIMDPIRSRLGLHGKRPKKRPKEYELRITPQNALDRYERLSLAEHPLSLQLICFQPAGSISGIPEFTSNERSEINAFMTDRLVFDPAKFGRPDAAKVPLFWTYPPKEELFKFNDRYDGQQIDFGGGFPLMKFSRMLAKIAHSYAVAEIGPSSFNPFLLDFMKHGSRDPFFLVGGEYRINGDKVETHPPSEARHVLRLSHSRFANADILLAHVRLFADLGAPQYHVVVGQL